MTQDMAIQTAVFTALCTLGQSAIACRLSVCLSVHKKKLKPDKFFMGKPSQNYAVPPKYGAHNFACSPT